MTTLNLPDPIAAYFAADRRERRRHRPLLHGASRREGRRPHLHRPRSHQGMEGGGIGRKYTYTSEPFALEQKDGFHGRHEPGRPAISPAARSTFATAFASNAA